MRSCSCTSLTHGRSLGWVCMNSAPVCSGFAFALSSLDSAVEQLMVLRKFQLSLDTCEKALNSLGSLSEHDKNSLLCLELKAALCIVGIQAQAELNLWQGVLAWVLQHYDTPEKIPAKILQMCILLYSKVGEPAIMHEASKEWLNCPVNKTLAGCGAVTELYILHILLPCFQFLEARDLVLGQVGSVMLNDSQRQSALEMLESQERYRPCPKSASNLAGSPMFSASRGGAGHRLKVLLHFIQWGLAVARVHMQSALLQKALLALSLLFLLLLRMDPALPSAFRWISSLLRVLRDLRDSMFGPYHRCT
ncbi:peroxisome assembly protein 26 isoform X1 [Arapaima gigas]